VALVGQLWVAFGLRSREWLSMARFG